MYKTCPKCGHTRNPGDGGEPDVCPACDLIFSKWMRNRFRDPRRVEAKADESRGESWFFQLREIVTYVPGATTTAFYGRVLAFLIFLIWGGYFLSLGMDYEAINGSFMHLINLVFHEAGHVLFRLLGNFMAILGGSLLQIIVPMVVMFSFLIKNRDCFGAAIGLWWTGQSMIDIAPYIDDARSLEMPLLGGGTGMERPETHDWHNILLQLNMLRMDHALANTVMLIGKLLVVLALVWAAYYLWRQRRQLV